jgi:hypothetical protein
LASPRTRRRVVCLLFFVATTLLYTFPLGFRLRTAMLPGVGDYPSETALIAWTAHQIVRHPGDPRHLFDTEFFYPHSNTQAYWQSVLLPGLMAAPVVGLTGETVLAANTVVVVALVLSGVLAAGLAFALTGRMVPTLLAGLIFAHYPGRMDHLGTPIVQMGFLLPAILWLFVRFLDGGRWGDLGLTVLGVVGQALSSLYYAFATGFLLVGLTLAWALLRPGAIPRLAVRGTVGLVLVALLLVPVLAPYLAVHRALGFQREGSLADTYGMDLLSIFDPAGFSTLYAGHLVAMERPEGGLFPGFVVLVLAGLALVSLHRMRDGRAPLPAWARRLQRVVPAAGGLAFLALVVVPWAGPRLPIRDLTLPLALLPFLGFAWIGLEGRRGQRGPLSPPEWGPVLGVLTLTLYLLTLQPTLAIGGERWGLTPVAWVQAHVPGAAAFRAPGRWALVFVLPLALLAAFGLAAVEESLPRRAHLRRIVPSLVLLAVAVEFLDLPIDWKVLPEMPAVYRWLAGQPGDFAVVEFPATESRTGAWAMLWAAQAEKRTVNGAFVFVPPTMLALADAESTLAMPALVRTLQSIYPLPYAVIRRGHLSRVEVAAWEGLRPGGSARRPGEPGSGLRFEGEFGDDLLFRVESTPQVGADLPRWFSADFGRRHAHVDYAVRLAGRDPDAIRRVDVVLNGRRLRVLEPPAAGTLTLPASLESGDRNELRFVHRYALIPVVTAGDAYAIGHTGVHAPTDLAVLAGGAAEGHRASIVVGGVELVRRPEAGYHLAAIDPGDGQAIAVRRFDPGTWRGAQRLAAFVDGLPRGTIVALAADQERDRPIRPSAEAALEALGIPMGVHAARATARVAIGVKGAPPGAAVDAAGRGEVHASIGRVRPLWLVLDALALRAAPVTSDGRRAPAAGGVRPLGRPPPGRRAGRSRSRCGRPGSPAARAGSGRASRRS